MSVKAGDANAEQKGQFCARLKIHSTFSSIITPPFLPLNSESTTTASFQIETGCIFAAINRLKALVVPLTTSHALRLGGMGGAAEVAEPPPDVPGAPMDTQFSEDEEYGRHHNEFSGRLIGLGDILLSVYMLGLKRTTKTSGGETEKMDMLGLKRTTKASGGETESKKKRETSSDD